MLGWYLDILLIGHKVSSMLSIVKELTLQKELQCFITSTSSVFTKKTKSTTTTKNKTLKSFPEPGIEPGISRTAVGCVTSMSSRQLNISIEIKLFDCLT